MPARGGRKRTNLESKAFKSEIIRLRGEKRSIVEIARKMGVSRQYVSSVLIDAGQRGRVVMGEKRQANLRARDVGIGTTITRLEKQGEPSLASWLGVVAKRRKR